MSDLKNIREQFISKLKNDLSVDEINNIKTELFGKNGLISSKFKTIGSIPDIDRKEFASDLNQIKDELHKMLIRENRLELYESSINFLKTRIKLDQSGFTEDIFQH